MGALMSRFSDVEREILAARERIGYQPEDAVAWLIERFVQPSKPIASADGNDLSPTEIDRLGYEVSAFQAYDWGQPVRFPIVASGGRPYTIFKGQVLPKLLSREKLAILQTEVVSLLNRFRSENVVPQFVKEITFELIKAENSQPILRIEGPPMEAFILQCFFILAASGNRIRQCKAQDCNRLFVFRHAKRQFCSDRCQTRIGTRNFRGKEKLRSKHRKRSEKQVMKSNTRRTGTLPKTAVTV
jgi:hypothetical protein